MNAQNKRDYAIRNIEANQILFDSADQLSQMNQVAQANRDLPNINDQQRQILDQINVLSESFRRFETRLDEISIVSAKAVNANCVRPNFHIQWIRV